MPENNNGKTITTSFYPLYYFTKQIVGDKANVINITPSGSEPHDYEPTTTDIINIEKSELLVLNGGTLEAWGNKIQTQFKNSSTKVIVAGKGLTSEIYKNENGNNATDPHIWLDPKLAEKEANTIAESLYEIDPTNQVYYQDNWSTLNKKLAQLDHDYTNGLSSCSSKNIITSHAAFGYLAKDYNFNQIAISGLSPDSEPSPSQLSNIANFAKKNNVKYIFFESLASPKLSQTIANEIGAKTMVLNPIEGLTPAENKLGENYISIMGNNLSNLKIALECK
jgi:zinc transport system substrate-binding protein